MKNLIFGAAAALLCSTAPDAAAQSREAKLAAIESHREAVHVKTEGWIRDPYIVLGPDGMYYLTGTTPAPGDPREQSVKYNTGLGQASIVGGDMQLWRSADLVEWELLGAPYRHADISDFARENNKEKKPLLWAPELHWDADRGRWILVHCPQSVSCLAVTEGAEIRGPWTHPAPGDFCRKHDPSLFRDDDGTWYFLFANTKIARIKPGFSGLATEPVRIDPANRVIGHEGATMLKIGGKYVHFGTAWSTDKGRHGSYNLYYCTSDNVMGPYTDRRFAGRFLGHGTPFQDKAGRWWCTAFYNANIPPLESEGIETRDLSETAQTINPQGVTIVPLEVKTLPDGDVWIRAIDPRYRTPGPDEVQQFD